MASAKPVPRQGDLDSSSDFPNVKGLKLLQGHAPRRGNWETHIKTKIYTLCPAPLPCARSHESEEKAGSECAVDEEFWVTFYPQHGSSRDSSVQNARDSPETVNASSLRTAEHGFTFQLSEFVAVVILIQQKLYRMLP